MSDIPSKEVAPGPCAKRTVRCAIYTADVAYLGSNECANPQPACPREPGEGYAKCKSVCQQGAHAEIQALERAQAAGADLKGSIAYVVGHHYICEACGIALRDAGVESVTIVLNPTKELVS